MRSHTNRTLYRGYEIADLAANATFEEVAFLLLMGHKPSDIELKKFKSDVIALRAVPASVRDAVAKFAVSCPNAHPMSVLRTGVSLLSHLDTDCEDNSPAAGLQKYALACANSNADWNLPAFP